MTDSNRRDFLKSVGAVAGMASAMSAFPAVIREALAIPANNATKSINDVEHVVILMQENRSFDHYFGTMPGVRGFGDRFGIPLPDGRNVFQQSNGTRIVTPYHLDQTKGNAQRVSGTPHSWSNAQDAWNNGRMDQWPRFKRDWSMGHYEEAELDFQYALANAFTVCDSYHCALHGGTNPNRLFLWTGTNGPTGAGVASVTNEWDSLGPSTEGFTWKTYPERLQEAGVTWKVYQNMPDNYTDNSLLGFRAYRKANEDVGNESDGSPYLPYRVNHENRNPLYKGCGNTMPKGGLLEEFAADIKAGRLPQVTWIVAPPTYSEHPGPSSPVQGAWYIQEALNALIAYPDVWSKTALIVNFDENDGFFDHAPPPCVFSMNADGTPAGATTVKASELGVERFTHPHPEGTTGQPTPDGRTYGPGPRVPCYVVSPWSKGGWVNSEMFDHTSVLRFLETRFGVAESNISSYRRAFVGDLTSAFNFLTPNAEIPALPQRSKIAADAIRAEQEQRAQVPIPAESEQSIPVQPAGIRLSRALPYELDVDAKTDATTVRLRFRNSGKAGAVFHVYDKLHLDSVPRRYSVEAGKHLAGEWNIAADAGKYDLWVLGPNGFHRHYVGDVNEAGKPGRAIPEVDLSYDIGDQRLNITLSNTGTRSCMLKIRANAYETFATTLRLEAGQKVTLRRELKDQDNWYDYTVIDHDEVGFTRRFAGRLETGADSVSDPAFGMLPV
ncbi:phosphocholine-specific phospholipase C [Zavarzinia sp.]|uniref:phosphocholine-specific phospholipase C n=1 Tax=Zavarzinia sp. TaxID=2027920 RepID=UPI003BB5CF9F